MNTLLANLRWAGFGGLAVLLGFGVVAACVGPCPTEKFLSGEYTIVGLAYPNHAPDQEWIIEVAIGAALSVDREAGEAIIVYTRDGTTYEVRFDLED